MSGIPTATALAFLYLIRCSLHAAALKKNVPNVTRNAPPHSNEDAASSEKKDPPTLLRILECGYGYSQFAAAFAGSIPVAPAVAASLTMFKVRRVCNMLSYCGVENEKD